MGPCLLKLWGRYRQPFLYLVFGGLTTAVNYVVYIACYFLLPVTATTIPNLIAWVVAVLFAYATNRVWVFQSEARGKALGRELGAFASARVFTLLLETAILWVAVDRMKLNNFLVKLVANVLVIVLNYILSKLWIFRGSGER